MTLGKGLDIATEARALLDTVVDHFAAAGVSLPERRHLVAGSPREFAWDCEQLTVCLEGIGWGPASAAATSQPRTGSPASATSVRHVILAVTLVRCTPQMDDEGRPPPAAEVDAAAVSSFRDAGLLSQALVTYVSQASSRLASLGSVEAGTVEPIGPSATHHGLETQLAITIGALV